MLGQRLPDIACGKFYGVCATALSFSLTTRIENDRYTHPDNFARLDRHHGKTVGNVTFGCALNTERDFWSRGHFAL